MEPSGNLPQSDQTKESNDNDTNSRPVVSIIEQSKNQKESDIEASQTKINKKPKSRKWPKALFYFSLALILAAAFWQRQNIIDWYLLRNYQAPANIVQLADRSDMSDYGRKLFYINRPEVQNKQTFYKSCSNGETAVILGCYVPRKGIFLLGVKDERLDGIEEVTAAHEMLHYAYSRLSFAKRKELNIQLKNAYEKLNNENFTKKVNIYIKSGADINNELHSMLATEIRDLPPELDNYYAQYFKTRTKVVDLSDKFQNEFIARKLKVEELDRELAALESQIISNNKKLDELELSINSERAKLDLLLRNDEIDEYNNGVVAYNQSLVPYRSLISQTKNLISQYKSIFTERNRVAEEAQELNKALNTDLTTPNEGI